MDKWLEDKKVVRAWERCRSVVIMVSSSSSSSSSSSRFEVVVVVVVVKELEDRAVSHLWISLIVVNREAMERLVRILHDDYHGQLRTTTTTTSSSSGDQQQGYWHSQVWGHVGIFLMDVDHPTPHLVCQSQWEALGRLLTNKDLRSLIIISQAPLVDDSPADAILKGRITYYEPPLVTSTNEGRWCESKRELMKLLNALHEWQGRQSGRQVVVVGSGATVGVETVIKGMTQSWHQYLCGPVVEGKILPAYDHWCEPSGVIDEGWTYEHEAIIRDRSVVLVTAKRDHHGEVSVGGQLLMFPDSSKEPGSTRKCFFDMVKERRRAIQKVLEPSPEAAAMTKASMKGGVNDAIVLLTTSPPIQKALSKSFHQLTTTHLLSTQNSPQMTALHIRRHLARIYYEYLPPYYHKTLPLPSGLVIQTVVNKWNNSIPSASQEEGVRQLRRRSLGETPEVMSEKDWPCLCDDDGDEAFDKAEEEEEDVVVEEEEEGMKKGGEKKVKVYVPMAFLDDEYFVKFCIDCFRTAVTFQTRYGRASAATTAPTTRRSIE